MDQSDPSRVFSNVRCITFLAPLLALIPFVHSYAGYPDDRVASNLFMGFLTTVIAMFSIYPISYDIAKVRHSTNMLTAFLYLIFVNTLYSMLLRHISGYIIFPFEAVAIGIVGVPINNSLLRPKIVPIKDSLNNNKNRWVHLRLWMDLPSEHRFDERTENRFRQSFKFVLLSWGFGGLYVRGVRAVTYSFTRSLKL